MKEEKKIILEMLSAGKINVSEAEKLLESSSSSISPSSLAKSDNKKFLKILVAEGDLTKVNINIPIALAEVGLKLVPKDQLRIEGTEINVDDILRMIKEGVVGELINIETTDKGKEVKVKVFID